MSNRFFEPQKYFFEFNVIIIYDSPVQICDSPTQQSRFTSSVGIACEWDGTEAGLRMVKDGVEKHCRKNMEFRRHNSEVLYVQLVSATALKA